tara:strand:- start:10917 stop:11381 length:465 start_codon:yes stop_codon:yes gene_type:complete
MFGGFSWQVQALFGMCVMATYSLFVPFMFKNFGIKPAETASLWLIGTTIGVTSISFLSSGGIKFGGSYSIALVVVLIGLVFGALMNVAIAQSFTKAPNPAYTNMIINMVTVTVFALGFAMFKLFPSYFPEVHINWRGILAILLGFASVYLASTS